MYMSPEYLQDIQDGRPKPKSYELNDAFSLGLIVLEMASLSNISDFFC